MTDTPTDPPPWQTGPGPDYDPPPLHDLIDPALHEHTHTEGRNLVLAVLAEKGIRPGPKHWITPNTTEGA